MIEKRHLPRAPIKEALIDIQVAPPERISVDVLRSKHAEIAEQYPKSETLQRVEFGVQNEQNQSASVTAGHTVAGYRYSSNDELHIVQFRIDGFTFSRLEPYDTWEDMKDEAVRLWRLYADAVSPDSITRVGTRYINILKLPLDAELKNYLAAPPTIPPGLSQKLGGFLTKIDIQDPTIEARGFLIQALQGVYANHVSIALDIDVFVVGPFEPQEDEFWQRLEQLRDFKNRVFFESITEKTGKLFQ